MDQIKVGGCGRVVVNREGEAWISSRAKDAGFVPEIIFRRNDGWTLGAPDHLEHVAYGLWEKEWTHFARRGDEFFSRIETY